MVCLSPASAQWARGGFGGYRGGAVGGYAGRGLYSSGTANLGLYAAAVAANSNTNFFDSSGGLGAALNSVNRYGYGGNGLGYGADGLGYGSLGYNGFGYGGLGYGYGGGYGYSGSGWATSATSGSSAADPNVLALNALRPGEGRVDYAQKGQIDFKIGNYSQAVNELKHAMIDQPRNSGSLSLWLGQAMFAQGEFETAAGLIQAGMNQLPESKWGSVVSNFKQVYSDPQAFTNQLRALEKARNASPDSAALRFLLGYEYGYLNFPRDAARELDKAIQLNPRDPFAVVLRNEFGAKIGLKNVPLPKPEPPTQNTK
jgi:tetratricopeptide (TPR) repeat protein